MWVTVIAAAVSGFGGALIAAVVTLVIRKDERETDKEKEKLAEERQARHEHIIIHERLDQKLDLRLGTIERDLNNLGRKLSEIAGTMRILLKDQYGVPDTGFIYKPDPPGRTGEPLT